MLEKKKGLIFGVANDHSIAWGIAKSLKEQGAEIALTYQNETFLKRVKPLADSIESEILIECDVAEEKNIHNCFNNIKKYWSSIDFIIHAAVRGGRRIREDISDDFYNNVRMFEVLASQGIPMITFCSGAVYGRQEDIY